MVTKEMREELEIEFEKRINRRNQVFCPLIKGTCNTDCECYSKPTIFENNHVEGGHCTAYILHGDNY